MNPYIVKKPVITEKALGLANEKNTYTFLVQATASKTQVKETIESLFSVEVERVRTITDQPKSKKTGKRRLSATQAREKKALVTLKAGHTIALFEIGATE